MCIKPTIIWVERGPIWEPEPVACRKCWRCKENRLSDYTARAMCEAAYSETTATITLTYAPRDDLADKMLHPRHFQLFMKLLRRAGHKVRYLVAGEYGDKGRAHFHAVLFFQNLLPLVGRDKAGKIVQRGMVPRYKDDYPEGFSQADAPFCREIPQKRMVHIREWPHGHVQVDWTGSERAIRYVCKYIINEDKQNAWFSLSKKPTLGWQFFAEKAALARQLGVKPSRFEYMPPGGNRDRPYLMTGATRRDYLDAVTSEGVDEDTLSEWVAKSYEKLKKFKQEKQFDALPVQEQNALIDQEMAARQHELNFVRESRARWANRRIDELLDQGHEIALWSDRDLPELWQDEDGKWHAKARRRATLGGIPL